MSCVGEKWKRGDGFFFFFFFKRVHYANYERTVGDQRGLDFNRLLPSAGASLFCNEYIIGNVNICRA